MEMHTNGKGYDQIAKELNRTISSVCSFINRNKRNIKAVNKDIKVAQETGRNKVSMLSNGDIVFEAIIELLQGEPITPQTLMKAHNLDSEKWKIISFTSNAWQSQIKGGEKTTLWQSKITVRENKDTQITFETIDNYFKNATFKTRKIMPTFSYNKSKETLEIVYTDPHIGLLSWRHETGADYDLDIVAQRFKDCIADTVNRCKGRKFKKILFVTLGDILHIDNDKNETTAGTLQQADGRISKIFDKAVNLIMDCIEKLFELKTPIEYVYTSGNHDRNTGYFLAKTLKMAYSKNKNIVFDIKPNPTKAKVIGNNLIGFCHGDMPRKNLGEWLQKTYRKEFGNSRFAEVHCGHLHSEITKENCGVLVKNLPTICESSYWEHQQGYKSTRGTMCFVWNDDTGLRETWYNYI